jgi:Protein of unknown function (DUF3309)
VRWRTDRRFGYHYASHHSIRLAPHGARALHTEQVMSIGTILLVILFLMLIGALPVWKHASGWGYGPSGILGTVLVVVVILFLMGRL